MFYVQLKSMQIIIAVITFLSYVKCITNNGFGGSDSHSHAVEHDNYKSTPLSTTDIKNAIPLHLPNNMGYESNLFRPSQRIEFSLSDVVTPNTLPSSYFDAINPKTTSTEDAVIRNNMDRQSFFPMEQHGAAGLSVSKPLNPSKNYKYKYQTQMPFSVPTELKSTPILTYLDPYSNENYHYTSTPSFAEVNNNNNQQHLYQKQLQQQQENARQEHQEYTVQSSLLVDSTNHNAGFHHTNSANTKRPGYVFDAHVYPPEQRPAYDKTQMTFIENGNQQELTQTRKQIQNTGAAAPQKKNSEHLLSYDSHDYPPPTYYKQQTSNFQSPQRQYIANYATPSSSSLSSVSPSHTPNPNSYGNYLQNNRYQYPENYKRPNPQELERPQSPLFFNNHNNEYQQGEIPPSMQLVRQQPPLNYPSYRPPYDAPSSGLTSLLTSTQQYAPQFASIFLGNKKVGSEEASNPLGNLLGAFTGTSSNSLTSSGGYLRPPNSQLIRALENIARNDDLQCVPKVLCQMIASQTKRGQLPSFITSPAITNFLAGFPTASPALIYGRAALLGISGGDKSCMQTYTSCPKTEYEILYYLNNHRGGFFKFFSEPEEQVSNQPQTPDAGESSLFGILSALTGNPTVKTTTPRPTPRPTVSGFDITSGIGNFFSSILSEYLGGVEYQRRRRRRSVLNNETKSPADADTDQEALSKDFNDEEDEEDTYNGTESDDGDQPIDVEGRILHKPIIALNDAKFFPEDENQNFDNIKNVFAEFNNVKMERKLKFPTDVGTVTHGNRQVSNNDAQKPYKPKEKYFEYDSNYYDNGNYDDSKRDNNIIFQDEIDDQPNYPNYSKKYPRQGKKLIFDDSDNSQSFEQPQTVSIRYQKEPQDGRVIFPDHYETHIRKGRILNRPSYAEGYVDYVRGSYNNDKFVISNAQRPSSNQDSTFDSNRLNTYGTSQSFQSAQNNYASSTNTYSSTGNYNENFQAGKRRPSVGSNSNYPKYENSGNNQNINYNYPNSNYGNSNRYSSNYQAVQATHRPRKHEDDKNVYITNSQGITEYYLTPDGRKMYL